MTTSQVAGKANHRLPTWARTVIIGYLALVAALLGIDLVLQAAELGTRDGVSGLLILSVVALTLPVSTAYYVVGALGSSQASMPGELAIGALSLSTALYYLGFLLLAAINAVVFRWIVLGVRRKRSAQSA